MAFQANNILYALMKIVSVGAKTLKDIFITKLFIINWYLSGNIHNIYIFIVEYKYNRFFDNAFNKKIQQCTKDYVRLPFAVI